MKRPVIGINANLVQIEDSLFARLHQDYYQAIVRAGGIPLIFPILKDLEIIRSLLKLIDGLLFTGGADVIPSLYGEKSLPQTETVLPQKQWFDLQLVKYAWQKRIPSLLICYGMQLLNVARGGSLFQDIKTQLKVANHKNTSHKVYLAEGTLLYKIIGKPFIHTNSNHHQAIKELGKNLRINARSEDGLIEGIESIDPDHFMIGVQWHPERIIKEPIQFNLFRALVKRSSWRTKI